MKSLVFRFGAAIHRVLAVTAITTCSFACVGIPRGLAADATPDAESPEAERASFRVLEGFDVQLFASEKEGAVKPIAIRFDADGRLWVVGSTAYPQIKPGEVANDKVTILEDTDGDGHADRSTIFVDGLQLPLGLELGDGGVWVSSATELVHARDLNGDGRADERRVVLRGFGTGDAHQTINSFAWGPSGELMVSQGLHANSRVETPWGLAELRQAGLFRFWPRRLKLEPIWSGAMGAHNPYGTTFDRWGQPFVFAGNGHGVYHLTQALVPTDHFLLQSALWQQGRKFGGADVVENAAWPEANQGEFVAGGYLQNTVERFRITEAGSSFRVERLAPLIESTNTAFRIIDVRFGPDGALYLCDWYNRLIGHYQTSLRDPGRDHQRGRIWRVTAKGRPPVKTPRLNPFTTPALVDALASPERWVRQQAKRTLADRPTPDVVAALKATLATERGADPHFQFEALGVFASHEQVETNLLRRLASSAEPGARAYAARVAGDWAERLARPLDWLAPLVVDAHPRVRLEAVVACARVADARAVEVAARAVDLPMDAALEYAFTQMVHATKRHWRDAQQRGHLTFEGRVNRSAAFARADGSGDTVAEAAARLGRVAEVALDRETLERLARIVAASGGPKDLGVLLRPSLFKLGDTSLAEVQASVLEDLRARVEEHPVLPDGHLPALLSPLLQSPVPALRQAALRLAGAWQVEALRDSVATLAQDAGSDVALRRAAFGALGGFARQDDRDLLVTLAKGAQPAELRVEALRALTRFALNPAATATASWLAALPDSPAEAVRDTAIQQILTAFLARKDGPTSLALALAGAELSPGVARAALTVLAAVGRREPVLVNVLERAARLEATPAAGLEAIPALARTVRESGRPAEGRLIFERPTLACVNCHSLDGSPGKLGPDLGSLGTSQGVEYILGAILDPQKEVKEGFMAHEIETHDGEVHQGYLRGDSAEEVALFDHLAGRVVRFRPGEIASRRQLGSLMPSGLAASLSRDELRDLVAFLARLGRRD